MKSRRLSLLFLILFFFLTTAAYGEIAIVFKTSGVKPGAAVAFRTEIEAAPQRVREWSGATFEGQITVEVTPEQTRSMALSATRAIPSDGARSTDKISQRWSSHGWLR